MRKILGTKGRKRGYVKIILVFTIAFVLGYILRSSPPHPPGEHGNTMVGETEAKARMWTCSMHPQIKLPNPGQCPICFMDLVPFEGDEGDTDHPRQLTMSETAKALAEIQTAPVVRERVMSAVQMVGKVEYDETRLANITAWVPGRIDSLYVDYTGISVEVGDPMVSIYSPDLVSTQKELLQAIDGEKKVSGSTIEEIQKMATSLRLAAEERLRLWGLSTEQIDEIKGRGKVVDHTTIRAPVGGVVIEKQGFEGMYVQTGTPLYTIADLSQVWVSLDAYESDMMWLHSGQDVEFTAEAYPGETFLGQVAFIDPFLNEKTRTVRLRVNVPNPDGRLKPGMFVRSRIRANINDGGQAVAQEKPGGTVDPLVIPASAPLITGKRAIVYVEVQGTDRPTYEGRVVELGPRTDDTYIVKSGLQEGEMVVVRGNFKIDSALQIKAKPSMMNPEGGGPPPIHSHGTHTSEKPEASRQTPGADEFRNSLSSVLSTYLETQKALASDDLAKAKGSLKHIGHALEAAKMGVLEDEAHVKWMKLSRRIESASEEAFGTDDIDVARRAFATLSHAILEVIRTFGRPDSIVLYEIYCSMAFDGEGASWVQDSKEIANPYYGAMMLRCGEVKGEF
ncbi:MAG: efflux RND transporter periplasmic adaptor subunit [Gemmatimonadota bacterium]|nr:MAG: efflux RND transporter periplasmic adaptor subunit [Gemmatimonadota bacterium]